MFEARPNARAVLKAGTLYAVSGEDDWIYFGQITPDESWFFSKKSTQPYRSSKCFERRAAGSPAATSLDRSCHWSVLQHEERIPHVPNPLQLNQRAFPLCGVSSARNNASRIDSPSSHGISKPSNLILYTRPPQPTVRVFDAITDCVANIDPILFEAEMGIFDVLHEDVQMVLISLPTPQAITQAHYALIALTDTPRFFTLEATTDSLDRLDSSFGFLCEWTSEGAHYNYGSCPLHPTKFVSHVMMQIRNLRRSRA